MAVTWKNVHVFISSTFNDMHAERDFLIKQVFPELREWCEQRKLNLVDIDLRWGITEQDATHNKRVIQVCLNRIDDCRPFFLCFLGQRRGWVPEPSDISTESWTEFPILKSYYQDQTLLNDTTELWHPSVTELEILHALIHPLRRTTDTGPDPAKYAFFYLREDEYLKAIPAGNQQLRETYTNEAIKDPQEKEKTDQKLKRWREEIIPATARPVHRYQAHWNPKAFTPELAYPLSCPSNNTQNQERWRKQWVAAGISLSPEDIVIPESQMELAMSFNANLTAGRLGDFSSEGNSLRSIILQDLQLAIAECYPNHMQLVSDLPNQLEIDQQQQFLHNASTGFVERANVFLDLDEYLTSNPTHPLVLAAPAGLGKSMLLAKWILRYQETQSEIQAGMFFRFIGASDGSTRIDSVLRSLLEEIAETYQLTFDISMDDEKLRSSWLQWIHENCRNKKIILVIDSINQLETGLTDMKWLPTQLPDNILLILSLKTGSPDSDDLVISWQQTNSLKISSLKPFHSIADRQALVETFLKAYFKELDQGLLNEIIQQPGTENPLYLKILLSELRIFGDFNKLKLKIQEFGGSPISAFEVVLKRLETDPVYSRLASHTVVPVIFGLLAATRRGLTLDELTQVTIRCLSMENKPEHLEAVQEAINIYLRQMRPFLAKREDRYDLFYESFRLAINQRYLTKMREYHLELAAYFFEQADPTEDRTYESSQARPIKELPYHLASADQQTELQTVLASLAYQEARCCTGSIYDLLHDFSMIKEAVAVQPYFQFLHKNAQKISKYQNVLFSLALFEGGAEVSEQASALAKQKKWKKNWINLAEIALPKEEQIAKHSQTFDLHSRFDHAPAPAVAAAKTRNLSFWVTSMGSVAMIDTSSMEQQNLVINTLRKRPLAIFSSPQGEYLAMAYDDGMAEIIRLVYNSGGKFQYQKSSFPFEYFLPEAESPIFCWDETSLWVQSGENEISCITCHADEENVEYHSQSFSYPIELSGEINGFLTVGSHKLLGIRQGSQTLFVQWIDTQFKRLEVCTNCDIVCMAVSPNQQDVVICTSDRQIHHFSAEAEFKKKQTISSPDSLKAACFQGDQLFLVSRNFDLYGIANLNNPEIKCWVEAGTFYPKSTYPNPTCLSVRDETQLECTTLVGVVRLTSGSSRKGEQALIKSIHTAPSGYPQVVLTKGAGSKIFTYIPHSGQEFELAPNGGNLFVSALDGNGDFLAIHISGWGVILTSSGQLYNFKDSPPGIISLCGDPSGGFWACEENGVIYRIEDVANRTTYFQAASMQQYQPGGSTLQVFGDYLVWKGVCQNLALGTGDAELVLAFFHKKDNQLALYNRLTILKSTGHFICYTFDPIKQVLYMIKRETGKEQMIFCYAPLEDFQKENGEQFFINCGGDWIKKIEIDQKDSNTESNPTAFLLTQQGNLFVLDIVKKYNLASLAPENPLTALSTRHNFQEPLYCALKDQELFRTTLEDCK